MPFDSTPSTALPHRSRRRREAVPFAWRIPVIGAILRELAEGDPDFPLFAGIALGCLFVMAVMTWGLPALVVSALLATPLAGVMLILISRG